MTGDQAAGILDLGVALERALDEVAGLRGDRRQGADERALPPGEVQPRASAAGRDRTENSDDEPADRALNGFAG